VTERRVLGAAEFTELLHALGRRLAAKGIDAALYVVGGAAIALTHDSRRLTVDVDCVAHPKVDVEREAQLLAIERGLPDDWLNCRAAGWIPALPVDWETTGADYSGLRIHLADARTLVAMKLISDRTRDFADLVTLFPAAGITRPEHAVELVHAAYPDGAGTKMPTDANILLDAEAALAAIAAQDASSPPTPPVPPGTPRY